MDEALKLSQDNRVDLCNLPNCIAHAWHGSSGLGRCLPITLLDHLHMDCGMDASLPLGRVPEYLSIHIDLDIHYAKCR